MVLDNEVIFSDEQAITANGATASTNVIDLGAMGVTSYNAVTLRRRFRIMDVPLYFKITEAFSGALTTMNIAVQAGDAEAFGGTNQIVFDVDVAVANLTTSYELPINKLPKTIKYRYLRLLFTTDGTAATGKVTSGIVAAVDESYVGNP